MFTWKIINEKYTDYLREKFDSRIPQTNYGSDKLKPFFGALFTLDDLVYVTQVTSPKPRHNNLKQSLDFYKIYDGSKLVSCINLNYMLPVPKDELRDLEYRNIDEYVSFPNEVTKSKYIQLLRFELAEINKLSLDKKAVMLYNHKYDKPNDFLSQRCFDFKKLEQGAYQWIKSKDDSLILT